MMDISRSPRQVKSGFLVAATRPWVARPVALAAVISLLLPLAACWDDEKKPDPIKAPTGTSNKYDFPDAPPVKEPEPAPPPAPPPANIVVVPPQWDFGMVVQGQEASQSFMISNAGGQPARVTAVSPTGSSAAGAFALTGDECTARRDPLGPGEGCRITVRFQSQAEGAAEIALVVTHTGPGSTVRAKMIAAVMAPPKAPEPEGPSEEEMERRRIIAERRHAPWGVKRPDLSSASAVQPPQVVTSDPDYRRDKNIGRDVSTFPVRRERVITNDRYINAVLENDINSQLPGRAIAVVERHVYGADGRMVLIPAGSRIVGNYESLSRQGDTRLKIVWERILRPDGASISIDFEGADEMGRTGLIGPVDNRNWEKYGSAILVTLLGILASAVASSGSQVSTTGSTTTVNTGAAANTLSSQLGQITAQLIEQNIDLAPVMIVPKGTRLIVIPTTDVWLRSPEVLAAVPKAGAAKN